LVRGSDGRRAGRSFALLLLGMVLFGIAQTSNLLARYARPT